MDRDSYTSRPEMMRPLGASHRSRPVDAVHSAQAELLDLHDRLFAIHRLDGRMTIVRTPPRFFAERKQ